MPIKGYKIEDFFNSLKIFDEKKEVPLISSFFSSINFYNPRHIKKVINKYLILCLIKMNLKNKYKDLIPAIVFGDGNGYIFDTIMVLYFIILHEFYIYKYNELQNYDAKFGNYFGHYFKEEGSRLTKNDFENSISNSLRAKKDFFVFKNLNNQLFLASKDASFNNLQKFLSFFTPRITDSNKGLSISSIQGDTRYFEQFEYEGNEILLDFCRFIYDRKREVLLEGSESEVTENQYPSAKYNLFDLFTMIEILL